MSHLLFIFIKNVRKFFEESRKTFYQKSFPCGDRGAVDEDVKEIKVRLNHLSK